MKVAGAISETLSKWGVREILGNPGTTELPFLEEVRQRYILTLQDGIAMGAADGLAQVDRRPSLVNLHAAPGLGNAMGYVDSAYRNRSPVIITVGQQDQRQYDQLPLLYGKFPEWVQGRVKWSVEVERVSEIEPLLRKAWSIASTPPHGPVLLSLPMNLMEEPWTGAPMVPTSPSAAPASAPDASAIATIAEAVSKGEKPAIVAGYEVDVEDAFVELAELSQKVGAPVFAEPLSSRAPVAMPLPSFGGDLLPASVVINQVLAPYDPVLLVGADLVLYPYFPAPLLSGKQVFYLGSDPQVSSKLTKVAAHGPLKDLLRGVIQRIPDQGKSYRHPRDFARANKVARAKATMGGEYVLEVVRKSFPEHTVLDEAVSNTPNLKATGFYRGRDSYFASRSGQLGWCLAAAIGVALRKSKTLVVIGDGALMYAPQALWTMRRYDLPVKVVVLNNHGYAILRSYSKAYHPPLTDSESMKIPRLDVVKLSEALGVPARSVSGAQELDGALEELRDRDGPGLLNVEIDPRVPDLFS